MFIYKYINLKKRNEKIKCTRCRIITFLRVNNIYRYAREVTRAIRYVALLCVTFSTGAVIFGYLTFMSVSKVYNAFVKISKLLCSVTKFLFPNVA